MVHPSRSTVRRIAPALLVALLVGGCARSTDQLRDIGYAAYTSGNRDAAQAAFNEVVDRWSADVKGRYYLGRLALDRGDAGEARRHLEIAYSLRDHRPNSQLVLESVSTDTVPLPTIDQVADALAEALYLQNNPPRLFGFLQQGIDDRGRSTDYLRQARYLQKLNDPDGAHTAIIKAIKVREPEDATPYVALAGFYEGIGDITAASTAIRKAYRIAPRSPAVLDHMRTLAVVPGPTAGLPPDDPDTLRP